MELIIGRFADAAIGSLSEAEVDEFERLLEASDMDIYAWITGAHAVAPDHDTDLFRRLRDFNRSHPGA
jgi:antitoxin CptB